MFNNKLYILGGFTINVAMTDQIWEFDPNRAAGTDGLLKTAVLPAARGYVPAATIGNYIYTAGGSDYVAAALVDSVNTYRYDPAADTIDDASIPELPDPRHRRDESTEREWRAVGDGWWSHRSQPFKHGLEMDTWRRKLDNRTQLHDSTP